MDFEKELIKLRPRLLKFAISLTKNMDDAKDLTQDVLLKCLVKKNKFNGYDLQKWSFTIMKNEFVTLKRKKKNSYPIDIDKLNEIPKYFYDKNVIRNLKQKLKEFKFYKPTLLFALGFKYDEIARYLDMNISAVKTNIMRSREYMNKNYRQYFLENL